MSPLDGSFTVAVPESILEQFQYVKEIYSYSGRVAEGLGRRVARISDHKNTERTDLCIKLYAFNGITQRLGVLCRISDHEFRSVQTGLVRQILEYAALGCSVRTIDIENLSTDPNVPKPKFVDRRTREPVKTYGSAFVAKFLLGGSSQLRRNVDTIYGNTSGFVHPSAHECLTYVLKPDGSGYLHTPMGIQGYADLLDERRRQPVHCCKSTASPPRFLRERVSGLAGQNEKALRAAQLLEWKDGDRTLTPSFLKRV